MQIEELDLNTRNQIYNSTKKVIRKYQKGISSGATQPVAPFPADDAVAFPRNADAGGR